MYAKHGMISTVDSAQQTKEQGGPEPVTVPRFMDDRAFHPAVHTLHTFETIPPCVYLTFGRSDDEEGRKDSDVRRVDADSDDDL